MYCKVQNTYPEFQLLLLSVSPKMRRKGAMVAIFAGTAAGAQLQKNPPKIGLTKLVKSTDHSYAFNNLTNFEHHSNAMTGNGSGVNSKKRVKSHYVNLFWVVLKVS